MWWTETGWPANPYASPPNRPTDTLDRDCVVTLTVGQLTDALAEALKVVSYAAPTWKKGDRALVEVEVTGTHSTNGEHVSFVFAGRPSGHSSHSLPASLLQEIV